MEPNMEPNEPNRAEADALRNARLNARALLGLALDDALHIHERARALQYAERARALVGVEGIRDIGLAMLADPHDPYTRSRGAALLGALSALLAEGPLGPQSQAWHDGYDSVAAGGLEGAWIEDAE
jgi:hypothetical protein